MQNRRTFLTSTAVGLGVLAMSAKADAKEQNTEKKVENLSDNAKKNYDKFFGDTNPLSKTDPEFITNHLNFAFGDLFLHSKLDDKTRIMLWLGCLIASGGLREYKRVVNAALKNGVAPNNIKEILYQSVPYVGFAKVDEFIYICNEVFRDNGVELPLKNASTTTASDREEKGLAVQRAFFGDTIDRSNAAAPNDEKHIRKFLSANCFGDYYTRDGLEPKFRELLTFVFVLSIGGADAQVKAHVVGNLNLGNTRAVLIDTVTLLIPYIGYPRSLNALSAIDEVSSV
ncbi:carboxymuconolactone decarboxylase family protein [Campylobacter fetus]|uniref:carboxymuconolactone decarboxylase family protein n=1 Tax=Campylobacter fetus TaxID=196 RepID=UPI0003C298FE|nr:carboxymuconolactone decarboxylase family protein [Campylobacter fetus]AGZ82563.1 carboxymuconolactone decarboxylase family protein [Campylobacter fetus subsp. testudinum 03-427]UEA65418.1 carboxymuconolactone decarboxylase family protein [Campylobacter fetus subsp. testudinum]